MWTFLELVTETHNYPYVKTPQLLGWKYIDWQKFENLPCVSVLHKFPQLHWFMPRIHSPQKTMTCSLRLVLTGPPAT